MTMEIKTSTIHPNLLYAYNKHEEIILNVADVKYIDVDIDGLVKFQYKEYDLTLNIKWEDIKTVLGFNSTEPVIPIKTTEELEDWTEPSWSL